MRWTDQGLTIASSFPFSWLCLICDCCRGLVAERGASESVVSGATGLILILAHLLDNHSVLPFGRNIKLFGGYL
jgi:hypothetical protein